MNLNRKYVNCSYNLNLPTFLKLRKNSFSLHIKSNGKFQYSSYLRAWGTTVMTCRRTVSEHTLNERIFSTTNRVLIFFKDLLLVLQMQLYDTSTRRRGILSVKKEHLKCTYRHFVDAIHLKFFQPINHV